MQETRDTWKANKRLKPQRNRNRVIYRMVVYTVCLILCILALLPVYWIITLSFKTPGEMLTRIPVWIPSTFYLQNYWYVMFLNPVAKYILNSLVISLSSVGLALFIGSLAAYSSARFNVGGSNFLLGILSLRMTPPISSVIPYFILMRNLRLYDSHVSLVLLNTLFNLPFVVWMMVGFFREIPVEIEEAAIIDGCSRFEAFRRIVLPLAKPGLVATAIFCFILSWNEFLFAAILTSMNAKTITVSVAGFITLERLSWGEVAAATSLCIVPIFLFAIIVQRHLVRGLTFGAVKG